MPSGSVPALMTPQEAFDLICGDGEAGLLDLREAGQFGEGHALFAVPLPWSRAEVEIGALVPRRDATVILVDAGDGVAGRALPRLAAMGYSDLRVVEGGMPAWEAAGLPLYKGVNVPSKTLGELAEEIWHPAMIDPETLDDLRSRDGGLAFFDARPPAEYGKMRVPGSVCLPNGELAHRMAGKAGPGSGDCALVITCAGRTRGIVGVIGVRLAGYAGPVFALRNGTQGWALSGRMLERGNAADPFPPPDAEELAASSAAADRIMDRFSIPAVNAAGVAALRAEPDRTTYLFDTRSAAEATADPIRAAVHAPSGQIVQATDQWIGLRHARVILCCDTGLRSALAAFWLRQLGHDARVLRIDDAVRALSVPDRPVAGLVPPTAISASAALARMHKGAPLLDLRLSAAYRAGHVAGAVWSRRPLVPRWLAKARPDAVLLIADAVDEAALVAADLHAAGVGSVHLVEGGTRAMVDAGAACDVTPDDPPDAARIDHLFFVHDRHDGNLDASRRYLEWETGLVAQLAPQERAQFRLYPATLPR